MFTRINIHRTVRSTQIEHKNLLSISAVEEDDASELFCFSCPNPD